MIDPARMLGQALSDASPDLMRTLLGTVINSLLSADADAVCGAEYGQPSPDRVNSRNGYRHRELDTRVGTIDVAIPKLRAGSYVPEWLLDPLVLSPRRFNGATTKPDWVRVHDRFDWLRRLSLLCLLQCPPTTNVLPFSDASQTSGLVG
jgi:hypothetical protein